jgi:hypothetical protein
VEILVFKVIFTPGFPNMFLANNKKDGEQFTVGQIKTRGCCLPPKLLAENGLITRRKSQSPPGTGAIQVIK